MQQWNYRTTNGPQVPFRQRNTLKTSLLKAGYQYRGGSGLWVCSPVCNVAQKSPHVHIPWGPLLSFPGKSVATLLEQNIGDVFLSCLHFFRMINYFQNYFGLRMNLCYMSRNRSDVKESRGTMADTHDLEGQAATQSACFLILRLGCPSPL